MKYSLLLLFAIGPAVSTLADDSPESAREHSDDPYDRWRIQVCECQTHTETDEWEQNFLRTRRYQRTIDSNGPACGHRLHVFWKASPPFLGMLDAIQLEAEDGTIRFPMQVVRAEEAATARMKLLW